MRSACCVGFAYKGGKSCGGKRGVKEDSTFFSQATERMELLFPDMGINAGGVDLGWKMKRSLLAVLSLKCLLDTQLECQKGSGGPSVQFRGGMEAGDGQNWEWNC